MVESRVRRAVSMYLSCLFHPLMYTYTLRSQAIGGSWSEDVRSPR
jgi:hypothetical protein